MSFAQNVHYAPCLPNGSKLSLFSLFGEFFPGSCPNLKIAIFGHETWPLAKVPEVALILSTWGEVKMELIFALRAAVSEIRVNFQNSHIWPCNLAFGKVPDVAYILSFYPNGSKLSLFSLYGQRFPRYGPIFKINVFGHKIWNLKKSSRSCIWILFLLPEGWNLPYIRSTGSGFPVRVSLTFNFSPFNYVKITQIFAKKYSVASCHGDLPNCSVWPFFEQPVLR